MVCTDGAEDSIKGDGFPESKPASSESDSKRIDHFENAFRSAFLGLLPPHADLTIDELLAEFMRTYCGPERAKHELAELFDLLNIDNSV